MKLEWPGPELNWGHKDFQSSALPTELPGRLGVASFTRSEESCQEILSEVEGTEHSIPTQKIAHLKPGVFQTHRNKPGNHFHDGGFQRHVLLQEFQQRFSGNPEKPGLFHAQAGRGQDMRGNQGGPAEEIAAFHEVHDDLAMPGQVHFNRNSSGKNQIQCIRRVIGLINISLGGTILEFGNFCQFPDLFGIVASQTCETLKKFR